VRENAREYGDFCASFSLRDSGIRTKIPFWC
jgi:hypothetical protein